MAHFYNKEIEVATYGTIKDENGINRKGWSKIVEGLPNPLLVDVQPFSMDKAEKIYGYSVECTKRVFMDIYDKVTESCAIKYNNQFYKIQKIIPWDDYYAILAIERDDISFG